MSTEREANEVWTPERCFITELVNSAANPEVSIAQTRVEPGIHTQLHSLGVAEWYIIQSGQGLMSVGDDEPWQVTSGDVVSIPKDVSQRILNNGDEDLVFVCVCTPRFEPACYTNLE